MSDKQKKPMTLKGILALVGAGLVYLVAQALGIDISALTGGKGGDTNSPPITAPADPDSSKPPTKGVAKQEPKAPATGGKELSGKKPAASRKDDTALIGQLFKGQRSDQQVEAEGKIARVLPDDDDETPHQRFLVKLSNDITILIAHNTDVSPRVPIQKGDTIRFYGEYEYNREGGVVHWTHRTQGTRNKHPHGWLEHKGKKYE